MELDHVVCWDCDGIVVDKNSLELHYADSVSAHPTCAFCGVGTRNMANMDEVCVIHAINTFLMNYYPYNLTQHVRHTHATSAEMEDHPRAGNLNVSAR